MTAKRLGKIALGIALIVSSVAVSAGTTSHKVRKGDTLWDLAKKNGVSAKQIARANGISEDATLPLDKVLRIPTKDSPQSSKHSKHPAASRRHASDRSAAVERSERASGDGERLASAKPSGNDKAALIRTALKLRGSRYVPGGVSRSGFDCSGFTRYVFEKYGICLPHNSAAQSNVGRPVSRDELQPGDLVFFHTRGRSIGHVAIYIGHGKIVHAANHGRGVTEDFLSSSYYSPRYRCARRVK